MSVLDPVEIADLCRAVGFTRPRLYTAIATALSASGGIPSYDHAIYPGPVAVYRGLWGVDLCEHEYLVGLDLAHPYTAAVHAKDLTDEYGDFGWCPTFRSGHYAHNLATAETASSMMPGHKTLQDPITAYAARRTLDATRARLVDHHNGITDAVIRRR